MPEVFLSALNMNNYEIMIESEEDLLGLLLYFNL
jgi:hypothetical protein